MVFGSLKIDSEKMNFLESVYERLSQNFRNRDLSENRLEEGFPGPFIRVESDAVGNTRHY